jgi:hypothetical protein
MNENLPGRFVEVNGAALITKSTATASLIDGGLVSSAQWESVVPELADGFRVITCRGSGARRRWPRARPRRRRAVQCSRG